MGSMAVGSLYMLSLPMFPPVSERLTD